jgi:hypothetical protein
MVDEMQTVPDKADLAAYLVRTTFVHWTAVTLFDRILSLTTLLSIFILGPPLGRAMWLWWDQKPDRSPAAQHIALSISTMTVITRLLIVYGGLWKLNPRMVAWYAWIDRSLPISGDVEVSSGTVEVSGTAEVSSGTVDATISNEPLDVRISR